MAIRAYHNTQVSQTCGVGVSGVFRDSTQENYPTIADLENTGGAGWHIASFTNDAEHGAEYKTAYNLLRKKWKIIMQSPVRINTRTGRKFFFCLYDTKAKSVTIPNAVFKFPDFAA